MKKTWIILRVVGLAVCLFFFISSVKEIRSVAPEINKTQAEVDQAWKNLEHAAPALAEEYNHAVKRQREDTETYSSHDLRAYLLAFPLALLLTSLLWQFVVLPIRARRRSQQPAVVSPPS
ncbi:hypothetical protein A3H10_03045 [Candidatus Uhrbacteria bacterium RIFCSPLOWO2_12_FULL_46_10]|uniref:Uncharacterized protein n=1 Tax=Candidatus Uhrbacteria bacterium RIFCSPLOWO2_01_FULL_47_25 TaxID=1802402 RepID=A0A1F7UXT0_9BACT|nr:MAG: hypothetical protein A2752_03090 [Candidatus Uhrbacteria bacterium RIFCSPHIGHO2_01_FULL_46_23]OGL70542.1 MAG: hypothetical protein A3D60_03660 [Candidatus Uhrbacteria bacterium RIFCSPHIGHO2_02_FULL_47_29]OGL75123.1 MAG: hypothetical protein A3E96_04250 [Candidatus Uhrbacteria bacterium RIFCSPHIGHO2_12_FULL_46_13]OGL83075.1 MAG: hypothetical protein A2936_05165 [Candidatus Uhrbacteria bacterium RIFCSPLOWO2_01_FULL_47_25]OGL84164.1 MAG: hypothetical protein A3I37_03275 [Candidatus Uhrbact